VQLPNIFPPPEVTHRADGCCIRTGGRGNRQNRVWSAIPALNSLCIFMAIAIF
jgi:hypothetical protein